MWFQIDTNSYQRLNIQMKSQYLFKWYYLLLDYKIIARQKWGWGRKRLQSWNRFLPCLILHIIQMLLVLNSCLENIVKTISCHYSVILINHHSCQICIISMAQFRIILNVSKFRERERERDGKERERWKEEIERDGDRKKR